MPEDTVLNASVTPTGWFWPGYRTVWRWHFYAGLVCIPFILWLSVTGAIYLFRPQIDAFLDRPYDHLPATGAVAPARAQIAAARAAVPGSVLNAYQLPRDTTAAAQILVQRGDDLMRVYVDPRTCAVLSVQNEAGRPMNVLFNLHGELLLGDRGSMIVELAASWAIVMILTGLYLWWPRGACSIVGVIVPRLRGGGRAFWRDLHAVTGVWVSIFTLFLLVSGLPWAASWGRMLMVAQSLATGVSATALWPIGSPSETPTLTPHNGRPRSPEGSVDLDRMIAAVGSEHLPYPALILPPSNVSKLWTATTKTENRTLDVQLTLAPDGRVIKRATFAQESLVDRIVEIGVAAHEGQLFGWVNQALGVFTAVGLIALSISAVMMWWLRRPAGVLGAPPSPSDVRLLPVLIAAIVVLGVLLPLLGLSLVGILLLERLLLRRIPATATFLGLSTITNAR